MGKVVGLIGAASGKVGNIVYAVTNGIQVARVYQPIVSNPKSALQNAQRAKGNLAGRISSYVPRTTLYGLGLNNRARRGSFLSNLLKKSVVTSASGVYTAKIADEDVVFSKGSAALITNLRTIAAGADAVTITLHGLGNIDETTYDAGQVRLVAMFYDGVTNDLVEVRTTIAVKPNQAADAATIISTSVQGSYDVVVYAIPMSTEDGSAVSISTDIAQKDDDDIAAILSVNGNAIAFNYGRSVMLGQATYTAA